MSTTDVILIAAIITAWAAVAAIIWGNYTSAKTFQLPLWQNYGKDKQ